MPNVYVSCSYHQRLLTTELVRTYGAGRDVWSVAPDDLDTVLRVRELITSITREYRYANIVFGLAILHFLLLLCNHAMPGPSIDYSFFAASVQCQWRKTTYPHHPILER